MNNRTITVSVDFVADALEARYQDVKDLWSNEASQSLWEKALELVEECGLGENITSPSSFVDNYLINGEFVSKVEDVGDWIGKTNYSCANYESCEITFNEAWFEYCQDNALIYNDEYACLRF